MGLRFDKSSSEKKDSSQMVGDDATFKKLTENSFSGISLLDENLNVIYLTPSAERISGWDIKNRLKTTIDELIHPADLTMVSTLLREVLANPGIPKTCSFRSLHFKGHYIWLQFTFTNMLNEADIKAIVCNFIDITAQQKSEEKLQETVNELSAYKYALDEAAIVAITDQQGIIKHVNDNFCRISKYDKNELIGQDHRIINSSYHGKDFIKELWVTIANGRIWQGELKNRAKDGTHYWVDTTIVPFLDDKGKPYQYVAIRSDITERKLAQEKNIHLLENITNAYNERNTILESIADAFFAVDKNWIVSYWNKTASKVLGKSKKEMLGNSLWDVFADAIDSTSYQQYNQAVKTNAAVHFEDYYAPLEQWFEISAYPTGNGLSVYFKDITERKLYEIRLTELNQNLRTQTKELAISNAELEQFAYVASHDLQEPLRMVTSFLTQIEKKYAAIIDDKGKQYIHFAVDGAKRMRQIILDLLEFSRVGRAEESVESVDLNVIVNDIIVLYRKKIEDKKATIMVEKLPVIRTSVVPLRQVFQNLISNALKYHKAGKAPLLNISFMDNSKYWQFAVKDNGIGIDPEYFDKIFIIFQRLHNKDEYSGTGMGLAVTKKIIENLGGKIWVESEEGEGTTFYFTILKN